MGVDPDTLEVFAVRELQRYIQALHGYRPELLRTHEALATGGDVLAVGFPDTHALLARLRAGKALPDISALGDGAYLLKTCPDGERRVLAVTANSERGLLHAVYGLLDEHYGMGFFLHGDVFPASTVPPLIPEVDRIRRPARPLRGLMPSMEPVNTWSFRDLALAIDQLAKMRMNLLQIQEPRSWSQVLYNTDLFEFGSADYYGGHHFGSGAALHNHFLESSAIHRKGVALLQQVLDHAHRRGLKVALAIEIEDQPRAIAASLDRILADDPEVDYLRLQPGDGGRQDPARYEKAVKIAGTYLRSKGSKIRILEGGREEDRDGEAVLSWKDSGQDARLLALSHDLWAERPGTGEDRYRLWAEKLFGRDLAQGFAALRSEGLGAEYPEQLVPVHEVLARTRDPLLRERLQHLSGRITFNRSRGDVLLLREAIEALQSRLTTITELGTLASLQERKGDTLAAAVSAKWTGQGVWIRWRTHRGLRVYRAADPEGPYRCITSPEFAGVEFLDRGARGEQYYQLDEGAPIRVLVGAADNLPPRVVVISPPGTIPVGQPLRIEALVVDDRDYAETSAALYFRNLGSGPEGSWSRLPMERLFRATFRCEVPAGAIGGEGVAWYVEGSDGRLKATFPPRGAGLPAFTLAEEVSGWGAQPLMPANPRIRREPEQGAGELCWESVEGAHRYNIYRGEDPDFPPTYPHYLTYVAAGTTGFIDDDPITGARYYRITAVNRAGRESEASPAVKVIRVVRPLLPDRREWFRRSVEFPVTGDYAVYLTLVGRTASLVVSLDGEERLRTEELETGVRHLSTLRIERGRRSVSLDFDRSRCIADRIDFIALPEEGR